MRLRLEATPEEMAAPDARDRLEKAIRTLKATALPPLPGDGEIRAIRELEAITSKLYMDSMEGLLRRVRQAP